MNGFFKELKRIRLFQYWDFVGWSAISFAVMYCVVLIFQICTPGFRFLVALQPLLSSPLLVRFLFLLLLLSVIYIKWIIPWLLKCKIHRFFIFELLWAILISAFVLWHFEIEPVSDFESLNRLACRWQTLPLDEVEKQLIGSSTTHILRRRCYFSYYMIYNVFGCKYVVLEISQLFMHLILGINVYFLAKQCMFREKIARLAMILYYLMPVQYLYLTIPSLDLWGGALLCFNANLIIYLFKKSLSLQFYKQNIEEASFKISPASTGMIHRIRCCFHSFSAPFKHVPWVLPLLVSILLGISLFLLEMVRNLQIILCIPMFVFLFAVLVRWLLIGKIKFFSKAILFLFVLCLLIPFFSNKMMYKIYNMKIYGSGELPVATVMFNTPDEIRDVVRFGDFHLIVPDCRKDFALDAAVSWWKNFPANYSRFLAIKMSYFSDLFNPMFVLTAKSGKKYSSEFALYTFLVWGIKFVFMPLQLIGILGLLFAKRWNNFSFIPVILFSFFFFLMPTVGECQVRYTSLFYAPMCVCAASSLLLVQRTGSFLKNGKMQSRFFNSVLCGFCCIILFFFAITSFFASAWVEKYQLINFPKNLRNISSGHFPAAYKSDGKYIFSSIFVPVTDGVIPEKTYIEWTIPEPTTVGSKYMLYGYLIAPQKKQADFVIKINGIPVWDNRAFVTQGVSYWNRSIKITSGKIIFLDKLKFIAQKENILRVEIVPKQKTDVNFGLSAWGMVQCK